MMSPRVGWESTVNFREMNLAVFEGRPYPGVFFQPRIEPWYAWHKTFKNTPARYADRSLLELFDDLGVSMRYVHYYTDQPDPVVPKFDAQVKSRERRTATEVHHVHETPYGELVSRYEWTVDETWRQVDFPVKTREHLRCLRWLMEHRTYHFDRDRFLIGSRFMGDRGSPQFWVPKSPYQALAQWWMKLEDLVFALVDCPDEVEATMAAIDLAYDRLYTDLIANKDAVRIVNFGENLHDQLLNPRYIERYLLPWYQKRGGQLESAGIFTHVHIDGFCHTLLRYLKDMPFAGIEALTPKPQGDVTLQEVKEHLGDKVLLDGIPAVLFMDTYSREQLMACVEECVKLFYPRLVLGVSDEVPEGGDQEAMERVRLIAEYCRSR
jgi:hypothetical protein